MATRIAEHRFFEEFFAEKEGFKFFKDPKGNLIDVTIPPDYELISKTISSGLLRKVEFKDEVGKLYEFNFEK